MRATKISLMAALVSGALLVAGPTAWATGNTDKAHEQCAQGGSSNALSLSSLEAIVGPKVARLAVANDSSVGGAGEGGSQGGLGGSNVRGGGAGGCIARPTLLPVTGAPVGRLALWGLAIALLGVPLVLFGSLRPWEARVVSQPWMVAPLSDRMDRRRRYLEIRERHLVRRRA